MLGAAQLQSSLAEKDLGVLVDTKLTMSKRYALYQKKKKSQQYLGCTRRSAASRWREVSLPFCSALVRLHLECWVQFWAPQHKRDMDILERVQNRATQMMKGLQHLFSEERLRDCSAWSREGSGRILFICTNTGRVGAKRWSQALSIGSQQQDKRQEVQAETQEVPPVCQETLFTVRVTEPRHRLPREAVYGHIPEQLAVGGPG